MPEQNGMLVGWKIAFRLWCLVWVGSELWQPTAMPFFPKIAVLRWSYFVGQSKGIIKVDSEWL